MQFKNSPATYGAITKTFHWVSAILIIMMLVMGLVMDDIKVLADKLWVYGLHKSLGVTILMLVTARILWHLISKKPAYVDGLKPWEKLAASAVHVFLYVAMVGMPMAGWLLSSAAGRSVSFFGLFTLPDLIAPDDQLRDLFGTIHEYLGYALIAAVAVHAGAALKHHFISKDRTLRRMLPFGGIALALMIGLAPSAQAFVLEQERVISPAPAKKWEMVAESSKLAFTGKQMGAKFQGVFKTFTADIAFDPENLAGSSVTVIVDLGSVDSGDAERDGNIKGKDFFNITQFPQARFAATAFTKTEVGYEATGTLTIGTITLPLTLPFSLAIEKDDSGKETAVMTAVTAIDRSKWNVGIGDWADPGVIANDVALDISVTATSVQ